MPEQTAKSLKTDSTRTIDIKDYLGGLFGQEDEILLTIKKNAKAAKIPAIEVSSTVGKLLYCLARIQKPKRILEIGTLAGYSTVWLARALDQDGKIISLEIEPRHAAVAKKNIALAGFENQIEIREGRAQGLMDRMIQEKEGPFDLIFIDADKKNYPLYLERALQLSRAGTLILSDNLIPKEETFGSHLPGDLEANAIYQFNQEIALHPKLESVLTTTIVGKKGRIDALGISIVKSDR